MKRIWILFILFLSFQSLAVAEEPQSRRQAREELDRAATKVYKTALDQMAAGNYWKAAQNLIVITDYYGTYKNMDAVLYQLGNCMFHMELYPAAERLYVYLIKNYIDSPFVSNALYGLERVYYADKRYNKALTYFQVIQDGFPQMNEMDGALYYAGQSFFYTQDFTESLILLGKISPKSSFGGYALYTMGLDYLKKKALMMPSNHSKRYWICRKYIVNGMLCGSAPDWFWA
jgi:outer membrane protein assembly factor BamD (BamD/ComL family)